MPKFTKEDVQKELRKILLVQADHLVIAGSHEAAERFIGFPLGDETNYIDVDPNLIDLSRFNIAALFDTCFDFAFTPSVLTGHDDSYVQDLQVFILGIPRTDNGGDMLPFLTESGLCQTVAEAVLARFNLDEGFDLTTRQVALMANMTEGAVRNALSKKDEGGLRAIPGTKNPVMIEHAEALNWLHGRRGFVPTPESISDDRFLTTQIANERSTHGLGKLIGRLLWPACGSPEKALETLGWDKTKLDAWQEGSQSFMEEDAAQLAEVLGIDVPLFVGKAREVTMRRDLEPTMVEVSA